MPAALEFTVETEQAVKLVQKAYGVKPTGQIDVNDLQFALPKCPPDFRIELPDFGGKIEKAAALTKLCKEVTTSAPKKIQGSLNILERTKAHHDRQIAYCVDNLPTRVDAAHLRSLADRLSKTQSLRERHRLASEARPKLADMREALSEYDKLAKLATLRAEELMEIEAALARLV